jgi:hypothetical protein
MSSMWNQLTELIREWLGPPLKTCVGPLDNWLIGLPGWASQASAVTLFVVAGLWLLTLKREYVFQGAPDQSRWRDLRIWSAVAMLPYVVLYLFFS